MQIQLEHSKWPKSYLRIVRRTATADNLAARMGAISSLGVTRYLHIGAAINSTDQSVSETIKVNSHTGMYHHWYHKPSLVPVSPSVVPLFSNFYHQWYHINHQWYQNTISGTKIHHQWYQINSRMTQNRKKVSLN